MNFMAFEASLCLQGAGRSVRALVVIIIFKLFMFWVLGAELEASYTRHGLCHWSSWQPAAQEQNTTTVNLRPLHLNYLQFGKQQKAIFTSRSIQLENINRFK